MGLMQTLEYLVQLCISIQSSLNGITDLLSDYQTLHRSLLDLDAIDVATLEKNVQLLSSYREDIDYIIETIERLSGSIQLVFWMLIAICVLIILLAVYLIFKIIFENRAKIFELFERIFKNGKEI